MKGAFMEKLLVEIGEFLAVDACEVEKIEYLENQNAIKVITKTKNEIILSLVLVK